MKTSIFDLFKIGIGPSSSHTVGPMRASRRFVADLERAGLLPAVRAVRVELYGSLALTGIGHGTDRAVLLGLSGEKPEEVDPAQLDPMIETIRCTKTLSLLHSQLVGFEESRDLIFHPDRVLAGHPNGMQFSAFDAAGAELTRDIYYSVGGGFIIKEGEASATDRPPLAVPHPFSSGAELLEQAQSKKLSVWQLMLENECALCPQDEVRAKIWRIWSVMNNCIERGLRTEGILPGGLHVRRRAPRLYKKIEAQRGTDPLRAMDLVNAFAMAVNEENAAGGRVVTAPTNGAAGLLPAVARYYREFVPEASDEGLIRLFLTAGAIGILYKENASISGAEVGCQGEVGVACS
ncbi:MAG: L-serine ammonia-lyase, partial [Acidobacteriaceae bacterium]|nr:L-serine ammonia-lyase [Acidobacteriaceae bacterium]